MNSFHNRSKFWLWGLPILLITAFVTSADAQGLFGMGLPGLSSFDIGTIRVSPGVKIGYQQTGLNFNFPQAPRGYFWWFERGTLDLSVKDANFWVGAARVDLSITPSLTLFVEGEGNAQKSVQLVESEAPSDQFVTSRGGTPGRQETGNKVQWWQVDVGASCRCLAEVFALGGVSSTNYL